MSHLKLKEQAMRAIYDGNDVFVLLPAGFGKSICFQAFPFFHHKLWWSEECRCLGVSNHCSDGCTGQKFEGEAVIISSGSREGSVVDKEFLATEENLRSVRLIFSWHTKSGDRLWRTLTVVASRVCAVIIDEAHCVSKW